MIIVIADDLTGAAELGGIGLQYGLVTEITTSLQPSSAADLLIMATDTRSLPREAAITIMDKVAGTLQRLQPAWLFKKIDSVLRGHVLAEIRVLQKQLNLSKALIVSANPGLGRTVVAGHYLLHGQPLHTSSFAQDPEFPVTSSRVLDMLAAGKGEVQVLPLHAGMPANGIVVGEVNNAAGLAGWCKRTDAQTLVVGAAEFFAAQLESRGLKPVPAKTEVTTPQLPFLAVWGSSFYKSRAFAQQLKREGFPVMYLPPCDSGDGTFYRWVEEIIEKLGSAGRAGIAIDPNTMYKLDALAMRTMMADAVALVAERVVIREFLVEGGATAAAVINKLGIETLHPCVAPALGVTKMRVQGTPDTYFTFKPGSYDWPAGMLHPGTYTIND
jgi:D-threonate/D-erythronate kinase